MAAGTAESLATRSTVEERDMPRGSDKRARLVKAADRLFHRQGFERSAIADVAAEAGVPAGNVYYYFKTKDEMAAAVVDDRNRRMGTMFERLERMPDPLQRLESFVEGFDIVRDNRAAFGCPIGNLSQEVNRVGGALAEQAGSGFGRLLNWLGRQFLALGHRPEAARADALHLLVCLQGVMLVAHTFNDPGIISAETTALRAWLRDVAAAR
jgi:AcrR family transcriptional regulator